ncbi:hypothetical protein BCR35DRAFT_288833 [Leucosporidium creatinivorum]|uniref:Ubiquitin-like domain-containing protein n=1 Tax=Leucosporidium creatinivorum TaxID=106004 RepID=A0A1Y2FX63_9BASI|nr:hypothetical protein BCR35DRAFT_288833 [Leucosporidium creatinivorum]
MPATTIVVQYIRAVLIPRPSTYADALSETRSLFSFSEDASIYLETEINSNWTEVVEAVWSNPILAQEGRVFRARMGKPSRMASASAVASYSAQKHWRDEYDIAPLPRKHARCSKSPSPAPEARLALGSDPLAASLSLMPAVCKLTFAGSGVPSGLVVRVKRTTPFWRVFRVVAERLGLESEIFYLVWGGERLREEQCAGMLMFGDEETIEVCKEYTGGKPVIYLFPPSALNSVRVDLTLVPEWTFSAMYPLSDITRGKNGTSSTSWTVAASPDGNHVDKASSLSLSYLFWEAHAPSLPPSPPLLPSDAPLPLPSAAFNPGRPSLNRSNAALLPFTSFLSHLDKALTSLSLHTSARNDFVTFWLPSFVRIHERGQQIAFRFLEQEAYEQAARLEVEPKPDVVIRVFLLFKGVSEEESEGWRKAEEVDWVKEVGVEQDKFGDEKLFRVLEWGGMEVVA